MTSCIADEFHLAYIARMVYSFTSMLALSASKLTDLVPYILDTISHQQDDEIFLIFAIY